MQVPELNQRMERGAHGELILGIESRNVWNRQMGSPKLVRFRGCSSSLLHQEPSGSLKEHENGEGGNEFERN